MDFMEYYGKEWEGTISFKRNLKWTKFYHFIALTGNNQIDKMFILQRYAEGWEDGKFEEKIDLRDCLDPVHLYREQDGSYVGLREYEEARFGWLN